MRPKGSARSSTKIPVRVERPARPAIWLDTSVLINIARARAGRRQSDLDRKRAKQIDRVVAAMVRAGSLLCIESEQRQEVRESGLNLVGDTLDSLALGVRLRPVIDAQHRQFAAGMRAYLAREPAITLPMSTFFADDPEAKADKVTRQGWMLTARTPEHEELRQRRAQSKARLHQELEQLRQRQAQNRITFARRRNQRSFWRREKAVH